MDEVAGQGGATGAPPKPPLALSLGIVGHRLNRLPEAGRAKVAADLAAVFDVVAAELAAAVARYTAFFAGAPAVTLVTSLAEGADRIAAHAAISRSGAAQAGVAFDVAVPLPFPAAEYERDFADPASVADFRALTARAGAVLVLPGDGADRQRSYEMAGLTVVAQSDVLLAVWNGEPSAGRGGTAEMVAAALVRRIPIVHIDPNGVREPLLVWAGLSDDIIDLDRFEDLPAVPLASGLPALVDRIVRPPAEPAHAAGKHGREAGERARLARYLGERARTVQWSLAFPLLQVIAGRRLQRADFRPASPAVTAAAYGGASGAAVPERGAMVLADAFGWADSLGAYFAQIFRSAFTLNFLLAAFAVGSASLATVLHAWKPWLTGIELCFVLIVLLNTSAGRRAAWHQRWFEARELAERLRAALPLWTLGLRLPDISPDEEPTWTGWYARAMIRAAGLRPARLDDAGLAAAAASVAAIISDQSDYHRRTAERVGRLDRRLELIGTTSLTVTIVLAVLFFVGLATGVGVLLGEGETEGGGFNWELVEGFISVALPALSTASYGIRVIGDFEGIRERSARMARGLASLCDALKAGPPSLSRLRSIAARAAETLLGDVANWRLTAEGRRLDVPG